VFACDCFLQTTPWMARPMPLASSSRGNGLCAVRCAGVRCACTGAPLLTPPSHCDSTALRHCVSVEYPRRGECCAVRESSPGTRRHADRLRCM
jgi:hypothetical protein